MVSKGDSIRKIHYYSFVPTSNIKTPLLPHQQRGLDKLRASHGLLAHWGTGSGKGLEALSAIDEFGDPAEVITPAGLVANFEKEQHKHLENPHQIPLRVRSYEKAIRDGIDTKGTVVFDEAQRGRNQGTGANELLRKAREAKNRIILSATPQYNQPHDLAPLLNAAAGKVVIPENPKDFASEYIHEKEIKPSFFQRLRGVTPGTVQELKNRKKLVDAATGYIDVHHSGGEHFPRQTTEEIDVPMSNKQHQVYRFHEGTLPWPLKLKIQYGLPLNKQESVALNSFGTALRQTSNTPRPYIANMTDQEELENSPKIQRAIDELIKQRQQNPNHRAVIYSNYLDAGLKPYARALSQQNIPHAFFTGNINKSVRDQSVKDYNAGKMPVMLVSGAGAEGLDLKNTRLIQMLDPAYNNAKLDQVQGRGIRYKSHEELPEDQRHVHIQKFYSTKPESLLNRWGVGKPSMAMDRYLQAHSDRKTQLMKQINEALQEASDRGPLKMNTKTSAVMQTIQQYGINPTDFKKSGGDFEAGACSCDSHDELEDVLKSIMQRTTDSPRTSGMIIIRIKKMVAQPNDRGDSPDTQDNKTENNETTEKKAHRYSVKSAMNPAISGALGGGAIGAITAGITPSIYRKKDEPPVALRDRLKNMAVAGTIGAGMGAIGGYGIGQEQFNNGYEEGSGNVSQALLESLRRAGFGK